MRTTSKPKPTKSRNTSTSPTTRTTTKKTPSKKESQSRATKTTSRRKSNFVRFSGKVYRGRKVIIDGVLRQSIIGAIECISSSNTLYIGWSLCNTGKDTKDHYNPSLATSLAIGRALNPHKNNVTFKISTKGPQYKHLKDSGIPQSIIPAIAKVLEDNRDQWKTVDFISIYNEKTPRNVQDKRLW